MAAPIDTETPSHREANGVSMYPTCGALHPSLAQLLPRLQEPITTSSTLKQGTSPQALIKKVSHSETVEFPQHFLPFCLLDASSL